MNAKVYPGVVSLRSAEEKSVGTAVSIKKPSLRNAFGHDPRNVTWRLLLDSALFRVQGGRIDSCSPPATGQIHSVQNFLGDFLEISTK